MRGVETQNRLAALAIWSAGLLILGAFTLIVGDIFWRGFSDFELGFLTEDPADAGRAGGIRSVLAATALILLVCLAVTLPIGLLTGIFLADYTAGGGRFAPLVRRSLDTLAGVPSIVFGLFGNAVFAHLLGLRISILTGGLTLAIMVLPFFIRSAEESLRSLPVSFSQAAEALGLSRLTFYGKIALPAALPGLMAGLVLGLGRALAETAALIFTSGYVTRLPESLLDSGRTLSIHILDLALNVPGGAENAYRTALVLIVLLFAINGALMALTRLSPSYREYR